MYSNPTSFKPLKRLDTWLGAHQRLNRFAYAELTRLLGGKKHGKSFPSIQQILQFEGYDGPDGIKVKTPAQGEPWHFYNPTDSQDTQILSLLEGNYINLVKALKKGDMTRAAFEAAWLAHGIVDGLTPAHHYPYEAELTRLRNGEGIETRTSTKGKLVMPGDTMRQRFKNNWGMWGDKGLLSTHMAFEFGVAVLIVPMRLRKQLPNAAELKLVSSKQGYLKLFRSKAVEIAQLDLYGRFYKAGWTPKLAREVRTKLAPIIVDVVMLSWYSALLEAAKKR